MQQQVKSLRNGGARGDKRGEGAAYKIAMIGPLQAGKTKIAAQVDKQNRQRSGRTAKAERAAATGMQRSGEERTSGSTAASAAGHQSPAASVLAVQKRADESGRAAARAQPRPTLEICTCHSFVALSGTHHVLLSDIQIAGAPFPNKYEPTAGVRYEMKPCRCSRRRPAVARRSPSMRPPPHLISYGLSDLRIVVLLPSPSFVCFCLCLPSESWS